MNLFTRRKQIIPVAHFEGRSLHILGREIDYEAIDRHDTEYPGSLMDAEAIETKLDELEDKLYGDNSHVDTDVIRVIVARWSAAKLIRERALDPNSLMPKFVSGKVAYGIGTLALPSGRDLECKVAESTYDGEWDFYVRNGPGPLGDVFARSYEDLFRVAE